MSEFVCATLLVKLEALAGVRLPRRDRVLDSVQLIECAPGGFAFRQGEQQASVHVVRSGLLKQYYTDLDGNSWIKSFTPEGGVFACVEALEANAATSFSSEAIEASVVERIPYRVIRALTAESIEWQRAAAAAYTMLARIKVRRERDLLMLTAEQLYEQFVADAPELSERIPQKDLAGYLGVTPVGLNRIIKRCRERG